MNHNPDHKALAELLIRGEDKKPIEQAKFLQTIILEAVKIHCQEFGREPTHAMLNKVKFALRGMPEFGEEAHTEADEKTGT